jgi:uncharacterized protein YjbI with pentapeptide repeats
MEGGLMDAGGPKEQRNQPNLQLIIGLGLTIVVFIIILLCSVLVFPQLLYPSLSTSDLQGVKNAKERIELQQARYKLQNDARTTLLQGLGGFAVGAGAVVAVRQLRLGRGQLEENQKANQHQDEARQEELRLTRRQLEMNREDQTTERFTRAIDQLGSDKRDVRIGGIYTLERIAWTSEDHRRAIVEVLTAYVRGYSLWVADEALASGIDAPSAPDSELPKLAVRAADVQVAMTVLGRRKLIEADPVLLELGAVDLRKAYLGQSNLTEANLERANLEGANLSHAECQHAKLTGAILTKADLTGVKLGGANLSRAQCQEAKLEKADLTGAMLWRANLAGANLSEAVLREATLREADLRGTNLKGAILRDADLVNAVADPSRTAWPEGFDMETARQRFIVFKHD